MNRESPIVRPWENLELVQELLENSNLVVNSKFGLPTTLKPNQIMRVDFEEIRELGLTFLPHWGHSDIKKALGKIDMSADDIKLTVIADSSFLKNRFVIFSELLSKVPSQVVLAEQSKARHEALLDRKHGFQIEVSLTLVKERAPKSLAPYRKGSILAETSFGIKPNPNLNGLNPKPLDAKTARDLKLPMSTELAVIAECELLEIDTFEGNLTIYMNEGIFNLCAKRKDKWVDQYLSSLALVALGQLVYLVSAELQNVDIEPYRQKEPLVISILKKSFKKANAKPLIAGSDFIQAVKDSPSEIAAALSGIGQNAAKWQSLLDSELS